MTSFKHNRPNARKSNALDKRAAGKLFTKKRRGGSQFTLRGCRSC